MAATCDRWRLASQRGSSSPKKETTGERSDSIPGERQAPRIEARAICCMQVINSSSIPSVRPFVSAAADHHHHCHIEPADSACRPSFPVPDALDIRYGGGVQCRPSPNERLAAQLTSGTCHGPRMQIVWGRLGEMKHGPHDFWIPIKPPYCTPKAPYHPVSYRPSCQLPVSSSLEPITVSKSAPRQAACSRSAQDKFPVSKQRG